MTSNCSGFWRPRVVPVLDLMAGHVVHGVGGPRSAYRPIDAEWLGTSEPADVVTGIWRELGCTTFYAADLDAIEAARPQVDLYRRLQSTGLEFWIDSGLVDALNWDALSARLDEPRSVCWVLATETLRDPAALVELGEAIGWDRCLLSVDLRDGEVLGAKRWPHGFDVSALVELGVQHGLQRVLVLDLSRVGRGAGPGGAAIRQQLRRKFPRIELWYGGGVRGDGDLGQLVDEGIDSVLVATAIYSRTLSHR